MAFYKENNINPLASCVPLLLQLPVFFALFSLLRSDDLPGRRSSPTATRASSSSPT